MIYADDPLLKEIFRRLDYLEKKVKEIDTTPAKVTTINRSGPKEVKAQASQIKAIMDTVGMSLTIEDSVPKAGDA